MKNMTTEKRPLKRVTARLFADTFAEIEQVAAERTIAEGERVTYNEVTREVVEIGVAVMRFQLDPTNAAAAAKLMHSNTTIAAIGAFRHFADNPETEQAA